jgi:LysR family hydrogen peroxide-inducible transcriptional activator
MIERYLLRYFLAVIDEGNFSRAATRCGVSQPTLSIGIAKLEQHVGHPLFNRTSRRVELTEAGRRLSQHAQKIEAAFAEAERDSGGTAPRMLIRVAIVSTLPSAWIEAALASSCKQVPEEQIEIIEGRQKELLPLLDRGRVDAVICATEGDRRTSRTLFTEDYGLALSREHPLASRASVAPEEVGGEPMIVRRHCEMLSDVSRFFTSRGIRPFMAARTSRDDRALAFVRSGLGVTVMPRCFADQNIALPLLSGFSATRTVGLLVHPGSARRVEKSRSVGLLADRIELEASRRGMGLEALASEAA